MALKKNIDKNYNQCGHVLLSHTMGYVAHAEMGEKRMGEQKQCDKCGLFLFPEENKTDPMYVNVIPN